MRIARLAAEPLPGRYDLAHLQAFHEALFSGIYDWAGQLRTVPLAKNDLFCLPQHLESYGRAVFSALARDRYLVGLEGEAFVERLAHHLGEVNALHPFREGNGRAQRALFGQVAAAAGYQLDWRGIDPQCNVDAFIAAMCGDEQPLRDLLADATSSLGRQRSCGQGGDQEV